MQLKSIVMSAGVLSAIVAPAAVQAADAPYEQDFILTAYYSPLPDQCCYIKGSELADKILNGNGTNGADGTEVYPGMLAAPSVYPFGTRIELPGVGIGTVHDRGGAIVTKQDGHRIDVWVGFGEEGLARALAFGVKRVRGTVYPKGSAAPEDSLSLAALPAPVEKLKPYIVADTGLIGTPVKFGDRGLSVTLLQQQLKEAGFFGVQPTGSFGEVTKESLRAFNDAMGLKTEPSDTLTETTAAYLTAWMGQRSRENLVPFINPNSSADEIREAQRLLRFLGFYRGRTNGVYDDTLFGAILTFQSQVSLVGHKDAPGAGRIGPLTRSKLADAWRRSMVAKAAESLLLKHTLITMLDESDRLLDRFLGEGNNGLQVRRLQEILAAQGFFPAEKINGNFGALTKESVRKYQLARGIIKKESDTGAGYVGTATLKTLRNEEVQKAFRVVRGSGFGSL